MRKSLVHGPVDNFVKVMANGRRHVSPKACYAQPRVERLVKKNRLSDLCRTDQPFKIQCVNWPSRLRLASFYRHLFHSSFRVETRSGGVNLVRNARRKASVVSLYPHQWYRIINEATFPGGGGLVDSSVSVQGEGKKRLLLCFPCVLPSAPSHRIMYSKFIIPLSSPGEGTGLQIHAFRCSSS